MVIELTLEQVNQVRNTPNYFDTKRHFVDSVKEIKAMFGLGMFESKVIVECIRELQGNSVNMDALRLAGTVFSQVIQQGKHE